MKTSKRTITKKNKSKSKSQPCSLTSLELIKDIREQISLITDYLNQLEENLKDIADKRRPLKITFCGSEVPEIKDFESPICMIDSKKF